MSVLRISVLPFACLIVAACAAATSPGTAGRGQPETTAAAPVAEAPQDAEQQPPPAAATTPAPKQASSRQASPQPQPQPPLPADDRAITVPGQGPIARCCPKGASPEECKNYLNTDVAIAKHMQCGGGWTPPDDSP